MSPTSVFYMEDILLGEKETITEINDDLRLIQRSDGLTFGTDALLLASFVKKHSGDVAADLGAGTGVISLLCAARGSYKKIYSVELQPEFADIIGRNAKLNGLDDVIAPVCSDVRDISPKENGACREICGCCDTVFSNPPFMMNSSGMHNADSRRNMARRELNGGIEDFCSAANRLLRHGGDFYVVYRPERLTDLLCAMRKNTLEPKKLIFVCQDELHEPSLVLAAAKKGASPSLAVPRPLLLYHDGRPSEDYNRIYGTGILDM